MTVSSETIETRLPDEHSLLDGRKSPLLMLLSKLAASGRRQPSRSLLMMGLFS
jgi:hypothetical protein